MSESLTALSYASTATFEAARGSFGVHPQVNRILLQSRRNNRRAAVGGMLHYGEGRFFQYLEGQAGEVDRIYERIRHDERHRDVRLIDRAPIEARRFEDWSMKFVVLENVIDRVLARHGISAFDPYAFTPAIVEDLVRSSVEAPEAAPDVEGAADATVDAPTDARTDNTLRPWWRRWLAR
jgi:hypothetical protein